MHKSVAWKFVRKPGKKKENVFFVSLLQRTYKLQDECPFLWNLMLWHCHFCHSDSHLSPLVTFWIPLSPIPFLAKPHPPAPSRKWPFFCGQPHRTFLNNFNFLSHFPRVHLSTGQAINDITFGLPNMPPPLLWWSLFHYYWSFFGSTLTILENFQQKFLTFSNFPFLANFIS